MLLTTATKPFEWTWDILSYSESPLGVISSFKRSNSQVQEAQQALLQNPLIQLNRIEAHVDFFGNEATDNLVKPATKDGTHFHLKVRNGI
ncbi:hypothetical protein AVEN_232176-1 [Araneus ventricosus]|uniref:RNase H type-1 domain-containing protein n=1 Tax=Araneus ventricosus TaxID=182803 RepID=A0A4Y2SBP6_ARAVE|nr:hypothetical protein AVEN_176038-1 [Araneus ventricosus]GBN85647.1 hypothetical protein AVEN_97358-1 [Araneus ventricosus]GBN85652.1 hypothetical protein AVEN_227433-1 [Araneus ventricosus]GBN85659.1 hypothetical protein AVEN_232176-1 [Araneus ventricosus]